MTSPFLEIQKHGQSVWYDNIRRGLMTSGELQEMVEREGLLGVTSNPAIFEKALSGSTDYDPAIKALVSQEIGGAAEIFERLAVEDIQLAADVLYPVFLRTRRRDGYVSMEVSPHLAHDTEGTLREARRLWKAIGRDNVMIKVPGTAEGIPAVEQLTSEGINVNVTLLFSVEVYEEVARAYLSGLEKLLAAHGSASHVASVASFFVSRIDSLVDQKLCDALDGTRDPERRKRLKSVMGKVAIANARLAYARYRELYKGGRWNALTERGARPQRLLWASTSTKNPKYRKTLYVEELIGPDTVSTIPSETWDVFRDEGRVEPRLVDGWEDKLAAAKNTMRTLESLEISMKEVTERLLEEGVRKFVESFDKVIETVEKKRQGLLESCLAKQSHHVGALDGRIQEVLGEWRRQGKVRRLWRGDTSLWSGNAEDQWLGWLHIVDGQRDHMEHIGAVARDVQSLGVRHVVLLGMGGSSLCPDVLRRTFGAVEGCPELKVLDSTVPAQILDVEKSIELEKTFFIVSSKSGTTAEPNAFKQYFFGKMVAAVGAERAGAHFMAITDPGTVLHRAAKRDRFRHIAHGVPSIGGRYSALSHFGMMPAAIMGVDVADFLERTETMVHSCASSVPAEVNPGVVLGAILGGLALAGRDKVTFFLSPGISALGAWLEQLLAESTGKQGKGLVPVDGEEPGTTAAYGADRLFVYIRLRHAMDPDHARLDEAVSSLERAGHPVVRILLDDARDLGQEFFRWEMATAVAGSLLGINPFDQPDVEASKVKTRALTAAFETTGELPEDVPLIEEEELRIYADAANTQALGGAARSFEDVLSAHLERLEPGDYFAINAYVDMMNEVHSRELSIIRHRVRDTKHVATTVGYGPRFLHSTGQLHKGGPNTGVFLLVTADDAEDLPIPGQRYSFGTLKRFQAEGDLEVLSERGRRVLRVHLGPDVAAGLKHLREIFETLSKG